MGFDWNCAREFNAYEVFFIKEENQSVYPNKQREIWIMYSSRQTGQALRMIAIQVASDEKE